jgi:hypothetical protein
MDCIFPVVLDRQIIYHVGTNDQGRPHLLKAGALERERWETSTHDPEHIPCYFTG